MAKVPSTKLWIQRSGWSCILVLALIIANNPCRLSREVQEKNKVIQQLQLQVRNKSVELSTSHNSSDSEASDRYSRRILDSGSDTLHALQCRDGKYGQGRTSAGKL